MFKLGEANEFTCDAGWVVGEFLLSINGLKELHIENHQRNFFEEVWQYVEKLGPTLQVLRIHTPPRLQSAQFSFAKFDPARLQRLESFTQLSDLSIDLSLDEGIEGSVPAEGVDGIPSDWVHFQL